MSGKKLAAADDAGNRERRADGDRRTGTPRARRSVLDLGACLSQVRPPRKIKILCV
jgi:hypothetical protein